MHRRLGSATLSQLAFYWESNPDFSWEKSVWDFKILKKKKKKKKKSKTENQRRFDLLTRFRHRTSKNAHTAQANDRTIFSPESATNMF